MRPIKIFGGLVLLAVIAWIGMMALLVRFEPFEIGVRLSHIRQRIGLIDRDANRTTLDQREQRLACADQLFAGGDEVEEFRSGQKQ